jgi:hypothetical protein
VAIRNNRAELLALVGELFEFFDENPAGAHQSQPVFNDTASILGESSRESPGAAARFCRCRRQVALDLFHKFDSLLEAAELSAAFVVPG